MSAVIKLSIAQISNMIQSRGTFVFCFGNLGKTPLTNIAIPFSRHDSPGLVTNLNPNAVNKF